MKITLTIEQRGRIRQLAKDGGIVIVFKPIRLDSMFLHKRNLFICQLERILARAHNPIYNARAQARVRENIRFIRTKKRLGRAEELHDLLRPLQSHFWEKRQSYLICECVCIHAISVMINPTIAPAASAMKSSRSHVRGGKKGCKSSRTPP